MLLIACSSPEKINREQDLVKVLFDAGLTTFHLRKPNYSEEEMKAWLDKTDAEMKEHIVLHSHWKLAEEYQLKGIHLGAHAYSLLSDEEKNYWLNKKSLTRSSSVHNQAEVDQLEIGFDYVWLSPVFESLSKPDYKSDLNATQFDALSTYIETHKKAAVYALGGITAERIYELKKRSFEGAVVLGALWNNIKGLEDQTILQQRFIELQKACKVQPIH